MKLLLRSLLGLCIVIVAIYAATPLWLPGVISGQLPVNWQLYRVKTGYPGLSGINLRSLQLKGVLDKAKLKISATDINLSYRPFQSSIGFISVDVFLPKTPEENPGVESLDKLSIPLINLSERYPELSIGRLEMAIHQPLNGAGPALLHEATFKQLALVPHSSKGFHLKSEFNYKGIPLGPGWLEIDLSENSLVADLQFSVASGVSKWLAINARQHGLPGVKSTEVHAKIDMDSITSDWLDSIIAKSSGGRFSHASGQLSASAIFSGPEAQHIQQVSLNTEKLQLAGDGETVDLSSRLSMTRDHQNIIIELTAPVQIRAPDNSRKLDQFLQQQFPEIQRAAHSETNISLVLNAGSIITITVNDLMSIHYQGGAMLDLENDSGTIELTSESFSIRMAEFPKLETVTIEGRFQADWKEQATVSYKKGTTDFSVHGLSVSTEIVSSDGQLVSRGVGELIGGIIEEPGTTVDRIDVQWQDFDINTLTANLAIKTHGLKSVSNGKTWSGFDLSADAKLTNGNLIKGSGKLIITKGPSLPVEFIGVIDDDRWDITIPVTTIKPRQLDELLMIAQFKLPPYMVVSDGLFDFTAKVSVNNDVTATMMVNGHDVDVSFNKSSADDIEFSFSGQVQDSISGSGPVSIKTISLASGIDITQLESDLTMEHGDSFTLQNLKANLFEGNMALDELHYANDQLEETIVKLSRIDLASLLAFADIDNLNGSGFLDFTLPVSQTSKGLTITDGTFQSTVSGFLAYKSGGVSGGNIGLQALENFQYKQLAGTINYEPNGAYLLTVQLEGANPDLYDGYPVKFNLNINGSLPELFESLFITGDFEEGILKQIKKR